MSRRNSLIDPSIIKAHGPGLSGGRVGEECKFRIEGTDGGLALSFHIEGPSRPVFETCSKNDMSLDVSYIPTQSVSALPTIASVLS
jgi:filamin